MVAETSFPEFFPLSGGDALMFLLDAPERGGANYCSAAVRLAAPLSIDELRREAERIPFLLWLASLERDPEHGGRWRSAGKKNIESLIAEKNIVEGNLSDFAPEQLDHGDDLLRLTLSSCGEGSVVVLSWHHSLLDAHGAELLLRLLSGDRSSRIILFRPPKSGDGSASAAGLAAEVFGRLGRKPGERINLPEQKPREGGLCRRSFELSSQETAAVWQTCKKYRCELSRGAFLIGASALALRTILSAATDYEQSVIAALPSDTRRKGVLGPIFPNYLTVFLFRMCLSRASSLSAQTELLRLQTQQIVESGAHRKMKQLIEMLVDLRTSLAKSLLLYPADKGFASFVVSYTGESLVPDFFMGRRVIDFVHYPPNVIPPGLSVVFNEFRGRLRGNIISGTEIAEELLVDATQSLRQLLIYGDLRDGGNASVEL
jgi:hypothetical protein